MEELGYFKIDFLNQHVYSYIQSPEHMESLFKKDMDWNIFKNKNIVEKLVHIGNYYDVIQKLSEPIQSIEHLAMFLATLRPGKKHLRGLPWNIVEKTVWNGDDSQGYVYKHSHGISYSLLIVLQCAILKEIEDKDINDSNN